MGLLNALFFKRMKTLDKLHAVCKWISPLPNDSTPSYTRVPCLSQTTISRKIKKEAASRFFFSPIL